MKMQNGELVSMSGNIGRGQAGKPSDLDTCKNMQRRCKDCIVKKKNDAPAGTAWKSKSKIDFCYDNKETKGECPSNLINV